MIAAFSIQITANSNKNCYHKEQPEAANYPFFHFRTKLSFIILIKYKMVLNKHK